MAGKKGKKSKSDAVRSSGDQPSEREIVARIELEKLNDELQCVKKEVSILWSCFLFYLGIAASTEKRE